ncbi:MAG: hypothetical protein IRY97_12550, partial [Thermomicrobiaceae bacterium]|nr:hypothetical protein [Thermomicrobiaceae bacterium]
PLFGERWPPAAADRALLVGGVALTLLGVVALTRGSAGILASAEAPAGPESRVEGS